MSFSSHYNEDLILHELVQNYYFLFFYYFYYQTHYLYLFGKDILYDDFVI